MPGAQLLCPTRSPRRVQGGPLPSRPEPEALCAGETSARSPQDRWIFEKAVSPSPCLLKETVNTELLEILFSQLIC